MKLPLSWIREFVDLPKNISIEDIVAGFVKVGFEVEGVENPAAATVSYTHLTLPTIRLV